RVEVFGEAYFEVAKMRDKPFRLNIADRAEVEVLGTHFNVNAYSNEKSIHTTLIEGSVKVKPLGNAIPPNAVVQLRPGQQAQIVNLLIEDDLNERTDQPIKVIDDADIDKVLAWKNGMFNFNNIDFGAAMRQLE